jgi:hypothetical protein
MIDPERAASLTIFMLRASVPAGWPLRADVVAFGLAEGPVDTDAAVRRLVAAPKPFVCYGEVRGDVLVIQTRLPGRRLPALAEPEDESHDFLAAADQRDFGPGYRELPVLCVGRDEWRIHTLGELEAWRREYHLANGGSWGGSPIEDVEARNTGVWRVPVKAIAEGYAHRVVRVQDYSNESEGYEEHVAIARIEPGTRPTFPCEHCGQREARYTVEWLEDDHPPRRYCQRCLDHDLDAICFDTGRDLEKLRVDLSVAELAGTHAELADAAEELAFDWALRHPPPFVREFIARHRAE